MSINIADIKVVCPVCKSPNEGHTEVSGGDDTPEDGDLSICAYCGTLAKYTNVETKARLEELTPQETKEALEIPSVRKALSIIRSMSGKGNA